MKKLSPVILIILALTLPFQVLAHNDHDPTNESNHGEYSLTNPYQVKFTLEEEAYIDDIPFNTEVVTDEMFWGYAYLNPTNNKYLLEDEDFVNDIPFDTEKVYWECMFNCSEKAVDLASLNLDEETYIDDIPFNTQKIFAISTPSYIIADKQLKEFKLEEEGYIDDIPFNTEEYVIDSLDSEKEEEFSITSFNLDDEDYIDDIPWDTREVFADIMSYPENARGANVEGMVLVSFHYNEDGYIEVDMVNASDDKLKDHVIDTLEDVRLTKGIVAVGKEYIARFDFKLK